MASVISGDANVSAAEFGYLDGVTSGLQSQIDAKLNLAGGKILQIVRATDSTTRSTTSTSYVDASISVTITPQKSDSVILLIWSLEGAPGASGSYMQMRIADASNNGVSGAEGTYIGLTNADTLNAHQTLIGYGTPATTNATTYKGRFRSFTGSSVTIGNADSTGQLYAIEVSA